MIDIYQFYGANEDQGRGFGKQLWISHNNENLGI